LNIAVVGAGISGLSATRFLAERAHDVTLFEQFGLLHDRGSSHGRSRIVRRAYPDALYTRYMQQAYPLWSDLQSQSALPILNEVGLVYFGSETSPDMISMIEGLDELNVPFQALDSTGIKKIMPQLQLHPGEVAVFTPEAGWVHAEHALQATHDLAAQAGAKFRPNTTATREDLEKNFDAFVVCAGSWIKDFVDLEIFVTKQTFSYFEGELSGPVWIEDSFDNCYGFPTEAGSNSFKIGVHRRLDVIDPNEPDRTPFKKAIEIAADAARRRFGFENLKVVESKGCLYTNTESEDFRLGHIGDKGFFASACSGHGFKFGPWIGHLMADFVERIDKPERYPRFCQGFLTPDP
jgi:sarcosine oxidase